MVLIHAQQPVLATDASTLILLEDFISLEGRQAVLAKARRDGERVLESAGKSLEKAGIQHETRLVVGEEIGGTSLKRFQGC